MKKKIMEVLLCVLLYILGCGVIDTTTDLAELDLTPTEASIYIDGQQKFTATAKDSTGKEISTASFEWTISDSSLATLEVDPGNQGIAIVTGKESGTVNIKVTSGRFNKTATLTIKQQFILSVKPITTSASVGFQQEFLASVLDNEGNLIANTFFEWTISDSSLATLEVNPVYKWRALVTGKESGVVNITVTTGGLSKTAVFYIRPLEIARVYPIEGDDIFSYCSSSYSSPCQFSIGADFTFPGEDTFKSARLFVDGSEVTSETKIVTYSGIEGGISYTIFFIPPPGTHQASVEAESNDGKIVTYSWSFYIEDENGGGQFETIDHGTYSYVTEEKFETILNYDDWNNFWKLHAGGSVPSIDFQKDMVIVVHLGTRNSGGYWVTVTKIESQTDKLVVYYDEVIPVCYVTLMVTYPYHIIKLPRDEKQPSFVKNEREKCN